MSAIFIILNKRDKIKLSFPLYCFNKILLCFPFFKICVSMCVLVNTFALYRDATSQDGTHVTRRYHPFANPPSHIRIPL